MVMKRKQVGKNNVFSYAISLWVGLLNLFKFHRHCLDASCLGVRHHCLGMECNMCGLSIHIDTIRVGHNACLHFIFHDPIRFCLMVINHFQYLLENISIKSLI